MQPPSSSSLPPKKPRSQQTRLGSAPAHTPSPGENHVQTKSRQTEIAYKDNLSQRRTTFSKRRQGLFKKADEICTLTDAKAAVIVFSETGKLYSFSNPSVEEIISDYLRCEGDVMSLKGPREWLDWALKKFDSCATVEDFEFLIVASLDWVRKRSRDLENNPSVAGAGDDSEVEVGRDSSVLNDDEIDSLKRNFKASSPSLFAFFKDYAQDIDFLTPPANLAAGDGSLGVDSNPINLAVGCGSSGEEINPLNSPENLFVCRGSSGEEINPLNSPENLFVGNGFSNSPENLFVGNGSLNYWEDLFVGCGNSGGKFNPMYYYLEGWGLDPNGSPNLSKDFVCNGPENLENLAVSCGSSREEFNPMCSDLQGCGLDPNGSPNLSKDFVYNGFLNSRQNLAVRCGSSREESGGPVKPVATQARDRDPENTPPLSLANEQ